MGIVIVGRARRVRDVRAMDESGMGAKHVIRIQRDVTPLTGPV